MRACSGIRPVVWCLLAAFSFAAWSLILLVLLRVWQAQGVAGLAVCGMLAAVGVLFVTKVRA